MAGDISSFMILFLLGSEKLFLWNLKKFISPASLVKDVISLVCKTEDENG